ncbi:invasion associated locus B family protein [Pseudotabrizicola sp. L79]|uniref:invasion associated locus B family protein n=1 Tax=Pseudotabrizicola sp. L79 TaxID=3118402 RepID=UPI002F939F43
MTLLPSSLVFKSFALSASVLLASVAFAQAQEAAAPAQTDAAQADAAAPDGLSMGSDPAAPAANDGVGSNYVEAKFDAWEQRCIRTEDGANPCQLYQLLKDAEGNAIAEFSLFKLPEGGQAMAGATIVVPLETLLTENLLFGVDGGKAKVYPFSFCSSIGCVARIGFTADEVAQLKKGAKATLTIVPVVAPDQKVNADLSLKGFTAGFDAVSKTAAP